MACMEHVCRSCEAVWMNNQIESYCPECGSAEVSNWFDEAPDCYYDDDDYEEEYE